MSTCDTRARGGPGGRSAANAKRRSSRSARRVWSRPSAKRRKQAKNRPFGRSEVRSRSARVRRRSGPGQAHPALCSAAPSPRAPQDLENRLMNRRAWRPLARRRPRPSYHRPPPRQAAMTRRPHTCTQPTPPASPPRQPRIPPHDFTIPLELLARPGYPAEPGRARSSPNHPDSTASPSPTGRERTLRDRLLRISDSARSAASAVTLEQTAKHRRPPLGAGSAHDHSPETAPEPQDASQPTSPFEERRARGSVEQAHWGGRDA